ncbi:MAG: paraquat-inducible membrane protein A [Methylophaga sp.]|nr:MAG: paraquat-inducible membrane protein A [Methylophaga sp.]
MWQKKIAWKHKLITIKPIILRWLLVLASLLLIAGFVAPILTLTKFVLFNSSFTIISGVWQLLQDGQIVLFIIVASFSVLLPLAKIILLFNLLHPNTLRPKLRKKMLYLMHEYGRWAMLDVMVVAILIVIVKLGAIASIQVHFGLYIFATAVLLIMFITQQVVRIQANH